MRGTPGLAGPLIGIVVGALLLGATGGSLIREFVEIVPALLVLAAVGRRRPWVSWAAIPVAVFWLVLTVLTWMAELGIVPPVGRPHSTLHVLLMGAIGLAALLTLAAAALWRSTATVASRLGAFWAFALLQLAALLFGLRLP